MPKGKSSLSFAKQLTTKFTRKNLLFIHLMTLNLLKLERTVIFPKYLAGMVSLIFLPTNLI